MHIANYSQQTNCSECFVWHKSLGWNIGLFAEGASELILTEKLLDAVVAETTSATLDYHRILH